MKSLHNYILEKLVICSSQVDEKLVINKNYKDLYTCAPKTFDELRKIIENRYKKFGPGTKQKPIDFNDVDVSNICTFYNNININLGIFGLFEGTKFKYIDISDWDVSKVKLTSRMFYGCTRLKSIGDLSNWNVSNVEDMSAMFYDCINLKSVGDLSNWDVSNVKNMCYTFNGCEQLKSVGNISNWTVSNVEYMFFMFAKSGITNIPKWYKE